MKLFPLADADRDFLMRSLRCHLVLWLVAGSVLVAGTLQTSASRESGWGSIGEEVEQSQSAVRTVMVIPSTDAHLPEGWRRTSEGWEHTSNWLSIDKSIDTWIAEQESREPAWMQRMLAGIRNTPPLAFAMFQLTMITAVVVITTRKKVVT
jgi:hypothetical protein